MARFVVPFGLTGQEISLVLELTAEYYVQCLKYRLDLEIANDDWLRWNSGAYNSKMSCFMDHDTDIVLVMAICLKLYL